MDLGISDLLIVLVAILVSMGFHEAMHAFTAHWLGDTTARDMGRLTLNPLKHVDMMTTVLLPVMLIALGFPPIFAAKPVPFNPDRVKFDEFGAALIGISGPLTNLVIAIAVTGVMRIGGFLPSDIIGNILLIFLQVNIGFFVFNMLPIPPLDGSRLLYAFAPEPVQKVMFQIEQFGFLGLLAILLVLSPVIGPIINSVASQLLVLLLR